MATWKPKLDDPLGSNEVIGRRLFDEPKLIGAQGQKPFTGLDLRNFVEKRDREFSIDRLGRTGIDGGILKYLRPRARQAATRFKPAKRFDGWATVRVNVLQRPPLGDRPWPVSPSPIPGDAARLEDNVYHAHITLPDGVPALSNALLLRELFTQYGEIRSETATTGGQGGLRSALRAILGAVFGAFRRI